jgi:hypothetical protein
MCGAGFALASWAVPSVAHSALRRERVAIVFTEGFDDREGVVRDLASEFRAEGFEVRLIGKELDDAPLDGWAARARNDGDRALIHVVPGGGGDAVIEVLLVKPDNLVFKDTVRRQANDASDIASVRAVEVTRAALIEVQSTRPPIPDVDIVRDDPYVPIDGTSTPYAAASMSPVLAITGQTPLVLFDVGANLSWLATQAVALELDFAFPVSQTLENAAQNTQGSASVSAGFVNVGVSVFFARKQQWFRPFFAVRVGALSVSTNYSRGSQNSLSFFDSVAIGASVELHDFLRLRAEASVGVSASPPVAVGVDQIGLPLTAFRIGPEVTW